VRALPGSGTDRVWYAAFSPDSQRIVTASDDPAGRIWDVTPRGQLQVLRGHTGPVNVARFSPDGRQLLTASDDTTARLWDAVSGRELRRFTGHTAALATAAFSPDGRFIATASADRTARIWETATGRELLQLKHDDQLTAVNFSHDGKRLVTASIDRTAHVWDATSGRQLLLLIGHTDLIPSIEFSRNDAQILTGSSDHTARLWDARSGRQLLVLRGHTGQIWVAHFSPDGRRILTAANDHTARLWDARSGTEVARLDGIAENVSAVDFSPDGGRAALSVDDRTARIWDLASNRQILALSGHVDLMQWVAFAPDGRRIVTASDDMTARIWDTSTPPLAAQISWVAAAEFDPLSSTQRAAIGLSAPADVRTFELAHSACDQFAGAPYDPARRTAGVEAAQIDSAPAIAACAPGRGAAHSARETYEYGRALAAADQSPAARTELGRAIARGYPAAGIDLARLLIQPPAATTDITRATLLLEHAWNQGVLLAAFELGSLYEHGAGGAAVDDAQAWSWYRRGADAAEPHALARYGERELQAAQTASVPLERRRHQLQAFRFYASAAERARREAWPDEAWRDWRLQRASLARIRALDGGMQEVAAAYDAVLQR
jgi:WD40 repeat protein/TPR repeat protein